MADAVVASNLNRRRYAQNDEILYVAPEDERTDYVSCSLPRPVRVFLMFIIVSTAYGKLV